MISFGREKESSGRLGPASQHLLEFLVIAQKRNSLSLIVVYTSTVQLYYDLFIQYYIVLLLFFYGREKKSSGHLGPAGQHLLEFLAIAQKRNSLSLIVVYTPTVQLYYAVFIQYYIVLFLFVYDRSVGPANVYVSQ